MMKKKKNPGLGRYSSPQMELEGLYKKSGSLASFVNKAKAANYTEDFAVRYFNYRKEKYARFAPKTTLKWMNLTGQTFEEKVPIVELMKFKTDIIRHGGLIIVDPSKLNQPNENPIYYR